MAAPSVAVGLPRRGSKGSPSEASFPFGRRPRSLQGATCSFQSKERRCVSPRSISRSSVGRRRRLVTARSEAPGFTSDAAPRVFFSTIFLERARRTSRQNFHPLRESPPTLSSAPQPRAEELSFEALQERQRETDGAAPPPHRSFHPKSAFATRVGNSKRRESPPSSSHGSLRRSLSLNVPLRGSSQSSEKSLFCDCFAARGGAAEAAALATQAAASTEEAAQTEALLEESRGRERRKGLHSATVCLCAETATPSSEESLTAEAEVFLRPKERLGLSAEAQNSLRTPPSSDGEVSKESLASTSTELLFEEEEGSSVQRNTRAVCSLNERLLDFPTREEMGVATQTSNAALPKMKPRVAARMPLEMRDRRFVSAPTFGVYPQPSPLAATQQSLLRPLPPPAFQPLVLHAPLFQYHFLHPPLLQHPLLLQAPLLQQIPIQVPVVEGDVHSSRKKASVGGAETSSQIPFPCNASDAVLTARQMASSSSFPAQSSGSPRGFQLRSKVGKAVSPASAETPACVSVCLSSLDSKRVPLDRRFRGPRVDFGGSLQRSDFVASPKSPLPGSPRGRPLRPPRPNAALRSARGKSQSSSGEEEFFEVTSEATATRRESTSTEEKDGPSPVMLHEAMRSLELNWAIFSLAASEDKAAASSADDAALSEELLEARALFEERRENNAQRRISMRGFPSLLEGLQCFEQTPADFFIANTTFSRNPFFSPLPALAVLRYFRPLAKSGLPALLQTRGLEAGVPADARGCGSWQ